MKRISERRKDLLISVSGFLIAQVSWWVFGLNMNISEWILRFTIYGGLMAWLLWGLRLKIAAEDTDPDSREAIKEYLKLGSCCCIVLFIAELPIILASL